MTLCTATFTTTCSSHVNLSYSSVCRDNDIGAGNERSYWAKGTGFGTGSTSSGWDVEQAMLKQKAEEEHVTCLLQVSGLERTTRELHTNHLLMLMSRCRQFKLTTTWSGTNVQPAVMVRQTLRRCLVIDCKAEWFLVYYLQLFHFSHFESVINCVRDSS